jgi:hypothetical protein
MHQAPQTNRIASTKIRLLIVLCPRVGVSIRKAHLSRILVSDCNCISVDPHRPADTIGLALLVLDCILRCVPFFSGLQEQYNDFPRPLIHGNHHAPHFLKIWSSFYSTDIHQNLILEAYVHWLVKIKILGAQAREEGLQYRPLHYYGHCIAVAVIVRLTRKCQLRWRQLAYTGLS